VYSGMSVMVNCAAGYHGDINGRDPWLDMLVMVGNYKPVDFILPTLKIQLWYNPRTITCMSGSALKHGVPPTEG
ncbi:hypothetical protein EDC04DRAFT_2530928, partial [Pisolithus marmoratus]